MRVRLLVALVVLSICLSAFLSSTVMAASSSGCADNHCGRASLGGWAEGFFCRSLQSSEGGRFFGWGFLHLVVRGPGS